MKIQVASDHAAYEAKEVVINFLRSQKIEFNDLGTYSPDRVDYPDYAVKLCKEVLKDESCGILLCGSGIGVSIVANRFKGIRAALCRSVYDAEMSRKHNDANVLCLGGRVNTDKEIIEMVEVWLSTAFEGQRHADRLALFENLGEEV